MLWWYGKPNPPFAVGTVTSISLASMRPSAGAGLGWGLI
jgi:hypothetical protein